MMILVMNNPNLGKILILLFLCFTKDAAKSPKKITNSNQKKSSSVLSAILKPFQAKEVKQIDTEDYQRDTMEWAHQRLILFTQNLEAKIFNTKKDVNPKTMGVNKLEKVPDKKTVFSLQWQDMKSHFLIPMSKRHLNLYTDETIKQLKKIKTEFFNVLEKFSIKLQTLWNEKAYIFINKYRKVPNPNFHPDKSLISEKTVLHDEMLSLLKDLPQDLMYWRPWETDRLTLFAEAFGPLPTKDTIEQKRKNFGGNVKGAKVFTAAELDGDDEEEESEKGESSDSDSSSSESSSSGSSSDYDTEFFNNLTRDYFVSDDESVGHDQPPSPITVPSQSDDHTHNPSGNPTESDNETHNTLNALQGDTDWKTQKAIARDRQENEDDQRKNIAEGKFNPNPQIELLKEQLVQSLEQIEENDESRKILKETHPEIIANLEKLKELKSQAHQPQKPSPLSHSSESSSPHHPKDSESRGHTDHSIQRSSPKPEEVVRPPVQTRFVEPGSGPIAESQRPRPDSVHDPRGTTSGPPRPGPLPPPKEPGKGPLSGDQSGNSDVNAVMSVSQEKSPK